jgi:hypothetical protein
MHYAQGLHFFKNKKQKSFGLAEPMHTYARGASPTRLG